MVRARFIRSSLWSYELEAPLVAVTAFGEALNYGTPALPDAADLSNLAKRVSEVLVRGGVFGFDVLVNGEPMCYRSWTERNDRAVLVDVGEEPTTATLTRSIVVFSKQVDGYRRSEERHVVRIFDQRDVERAISDTGLSYEISNAYGDRALGPRRIAVIARWE